MQVGTPPRIARALKLQQSCGDANIICEMGALKQEPRGEKTRSARGPNGFSRSRGGNQVPLVYHLSLNLSFEILSGDKLYRL